MAEKLCRSRAPFGQCLVFVLVAINCVYKQSMSPFVQNKYKKDSVLNALLGFKHDGQQKWFHPRM